MALATVEKINILASKKYQHDILEVLQNTGQVEIEQNSLTELHKNSVAEKIAELDYQLAGVKFSLDFLAHYDTAKKSLAEKIDPKINLSPTELRLTLEKFDYPDRTKEIEEIESGINEASSVIAKLAAEKQLLTPWIALNFVLNRKRLPKSFTLACLVVPQNSYADCISTLEKKLPLTDLQRISQDKNEVLATLLYRPTDDSTVSELMTEFGIKTVDLPDLQTTVDDRLREINQKIELSESRIEKLQKEARRLAGNQHELKITYDYLVWQREKMLALEKTAGTKHTFSLVAWVDKSVIVELEKSLKKITDDFVIEAVPITEDDNVPIIFKNSWARPFEAVTGVYGAPMYHEPDPTPWLAPFFILFFGLCLTDAGYGIILALLALLGKKIIKPTGTTAKMFTVMVYGGIVTFFAGAAVGGWFGIVIDDLPIDWLKNALVSVRLIDPVKEPIKMLIFSLILGIIQVIVGILVSMWWKIKHKNYVSAVLDSGLWLYFILSILFWASTKLGFVSFAGAKYLVWAGALAMIATQGRQNKNPILKVATGILSLYGLVGYLSDVLSYSRLLALGLATGIIAMVINLIGALTIEMVPYVGYVIAIFILIGGHTFNIGINALGAFIHSSRLQFVEFFPKFMEGGGRNFVPLQKESKYVRLVNK